MIMRVKKKQQTTTYNNNTKIKNNNNNYFQLLLLFLKNNFFFFKNNQLCHLSCCHRVTNTICIHTFIHTYTLAHITIQALYIARDKLK